MHSSATACEVGGRMGLEVQSGAHQYTAGARQFQDEVRGAWYCRSMLMVKNSYKFRQEVHSSATAGARQ